MYHPSRGGVRGGRDQFTWDDVKVDKHRENYLGHSIKAPVGRWQKGKDLHWYTRDKNSRASDVEAAQAEMKSEIQRIKEEEEQAMCEALGLAPKRSGRPQGNRLDKHEFSELVKRGSTAEDLGAGHAEAARVDGLGFSRAPRNWAESNSLPPTDEVYPETANEVLPKVTERSTEEESRKKRKREERKHEKRDEKRHEKRDKRRSGDSDDKRKREKGKRRHDSD
ncbi:leukocyte immunoglobulin-like receptor family A protein [Tasmannia lanceolata]|uniref:leukocyte immunoglobulin-like receptor family A protein n=1 Tax=Tasmannia lanceolata TaxID=3420 RepID=UPI004063D5F9